jgi:uncharacterized DUF497 family protein
MGGLILLDKNTSMTYVLRMKDFEWDENKRASNLAKHGIDFVDAIQVFVDPNRIEFESERNGEKRLQTLGMVEGVVIMFVVYTHRPPKKRIISARLACKKERDVYHMLERGG